MVYKGYAYVDFTTAYKELLPLFFKTNLENSLTFIGTKMEYILENNESLERLFNEIGEEDFGIDYVKVSENRKNKINLADLDFLSKT